MRAINSLRFAALCAVLTLASVLSACAPQSQGTPGAADAADSPGSTAPAASPSRKSADTSEAAGTTEPATADDGAARDEAPLPEGPDALYAHGLDVLDRDPERAATALEGAALQGHAEAAYRLGRLQGDPKVAVGWYSMAAAQGQLDAQHALGEAYLFGRGTAREPAWGLHWFERAARAGHARSQFVMGQAMLTGVVGPMRPQIALVWFEVARQHGYGEADMLITMLRARLSAENAEAARRRAEDWVDESLDEAESRATTRFAQYALGRLGYEAGVPDGLEGERTIDAVNAFRDDAGLGAGPLDRRTLDALRERLAQQGG